MERQQSGPWAGLYGRETHLLSTVERSPVTSARVVPVGVPVASSLTSRRRLRTLGLIPTGEVRRGLGAD